MKNLNQKTKILSSILLVEDEPSDSLLIQRAFKSNNVENSIIHLKDGQQALDYLLGEEIYSDREQFPIPGLILLDLNLPKVKGLKVLDKIKKTPILKRIPTIVLSASDQSSDINQAYDSGANGYITKPVTYSALNELVRDLNSFWLQHNKQAII